MNREARLCREPLPATEDTKGSPERHASLRGAVDSNLWWLGQVKCRVQFAKRINSSVPSFSFPECDGSYKMPRRTYQQSAESAASSFEFCVPNRACASLCAWALEELQVCEEFADWSETVLEPWYETQLVPTKPDAPESNKVVGCEVRLVYKALHMLPRVGGSYVLSLFEEKCEEGGFIVRAFDRAKRDAFWLSLTRIKIASFGENATRSPATLAATLARRLKLKPDAGRGKTRLVLQTAKKVEPPSEKKPKSATSAGAAKSGDDVAGQTAVRAGMRAGPTPPASLSSRMNEAAITAASGCPAAQEKLRTRRRSHPPPMRGSKVEDLGPLVEGEGDTSECSAGELRDTRPVPSTGDGGDAAVVTDGRVVEQLAKGSASEEIPVRV